MSNSKPHVQKGFLIVELIISMALFVTIIVIASGAVISLLQSNREARAKQVVTNNLSFILEDMTKNMRVGTNYHCGGGSYGDPLDCIGGTDRSEIAYESVGGDPSDDGDQVVYRLVGTTIQKSVDGGASWSTLTTPEVEVEDFQVYVQGAEDSDDALQPRALISMRGVIELPNNQTQDFNVQTTITQRILDSDLN